MEKARRSITGWHFCQSDRRLAHGDGREIRVGEALSVEGPLEPCKNALHMSKDPLAALRYAVGSTVCRVRLSGEIGQKADEPAIWYGRSRKVLAMADARAALRLFIWDTLVFRQPHVARLFRTARLDEEADAIEAVRIAPDNGDGVRNVFKRAASAAYDAYDAYDADAAKAAVYAAAYAARAYASASADAIDDAIDAAKAAKAAAAYAYAIDAARRTLRHLLTCRLNAALKGAV